MTRLAPPQRDSARTVLDRLGAMLYLVLLRGTPRRKLDELKSKMLAESTGRLDISTLSQVDREYIAPPGVSRYYAMLCEIRDEKFDEERLPGETLEQQRSRERDRQALVPLEDSAVLVNAPKRNRERPPSDDTLTVKRNADGGVEARAKGWAIVGLVILAIVGGAVFLGYVVLRAQGVSP